MSTRARTQRKGASGSWKPSQNDRTATAVPRRARTTMEE